MLMFCVSGIILNHRPLFAGINVWIPCFLLRDFNEGYKLLNVMLEGYFLL